ncbi:helix-turn-helix domain-containing protein [uncultured Serinicoccus sp.]|uniref:helix-turn-helix domain-containing protein n=1 Tax=uncultured Serinicoccus sp. TaxID=735514 RepID=UPI003457C12C
MPYPGRPSSHDADPELAGTAAPGRCLPDHVKAYVVREYEAGRSLRELAELTGRSHGAVRNILQRAGVPRRGRGAPPVASH